MKHANPRELIDSVYIPFTSTYLCLLILYIVGIVCLINDSYLPLYLGCVACGLVIYFTFLIYLRIKVFYYDGNKDESERRCPGSYPRTSYI